MSTHFRIPKLFVSDNCILGSTKFLTFSERLRQSMRPFFKFVQQRKITPLSPKLYQDFDLVKKSTLSQIHSSQRLLFFVHSKQWSTKIGNYHEVTYVLILRTKTKWRRWKSFQILFQQFLKMVTTHTVFENDPKWRIWIFQFWHFTPIFDLLKLTCLVTLFDRKLQVSKTRQNGPFLAFLMNFCPLKM